MQLHKPAEESTAIYRKTVITTETGNNRANNEHSFANRMKEMANSATKLFQHAPPNGEAGGGHYRVHQSGTRITSNTPHANATNMHMQEKKKKENMMTSCTGKKKKQHENGIITGNGNGRKEEKHGGAGFLANMEGQVKNFTHKVEGKGKGKGKSKKSKSEGHDSSSDSSSDDDFRSKKK